MANTPEFDERMKRVQERIAAILEEEGMGLMPTLTFVDQRKSDPSIVMPPKSKILTA